MDLRASHRELHRCVSWIGSRMKRGEITRKEHDRLFNLILESFAEERRESDGKNS